jgi:hypothetical protein
MGDVVGTERLGRGGLWRSRWAAIGAALAVTFGAGGLFGASAASPESSVVSIEPVRILDTRDPVNVGLAGPFVSAVSQDLKVTGSVPTTTGVQTVVPAGATGVFLNVTPVGSSAAGFISVRPANATGLPTTSNVNFATGAINPNAVLVELPVGGADDGRIEITYDAFGSAGPTADVLVDVVGYTTQGRFAALEANKADKAAVNSALLQERTWTAAVTSTGAKSGTGNFTSTRTGLGTYTVTFDVTGLGIPDPPTFINFTYSVRCADHTVNDNGRTDGSTAGILTDFGIFISVRNGDGDPDDCAFFVFARLPDPNVPTAPLPLVGAESLESADVTRNGACTVEGDTKTCVEQP